MFAKIIKILKNPYLIAVHLCQKWPFRNISDESYLKLFFYTYQGRKLDLNKPKTFNEKLQWLKLYDRRQQYTIMSDKYLVREYVAEKIGKQYLIPLIGVWEKTEDIPYEKLPNQFVLKCNHDSGSIVICKDQTKFNITAANDKLNRCLKRDYYWTSREYNYKNIQRRIIAEQYISDDKNDELTDYKFFCFNGIPKFIQVDRGRFLQHTRNFYTPEWDFINVVYGCPNDNNNVVEVPEHLAEMLILAHRLSIGIPHVRVDFYISSNKIYFGELTFHHGGGVMPLRPLYYDELWGSYLTLPKKNSQKENDIR